MKVSTNSEVIFMIFREGLKIWLFKLGPLPMGGLQRSLKLLINEGLCGHVAQFQVEILCLIDA